jgi:glutathione S-transferase
MNGHRVSIALEEMRLPYVLQCVNIREGDQFKPGFLAISPNNRMPAIVDPHGPDGQPISVFESAAILLYLARKTGQFYGDDERQKTLIDQWLIWSVAHLGPMSGQCGHFHVYAPLLVDDPAQLTYGRTRFINEVNRLYGVLEQRLEGRDYIADSYSIADISTWPWTLSGDRLGQNMDDFPNIRAWQERIRARPAVQAGIAAGADFGATTRSLSDEEKRESTRMLMGQTAATVKERSSIVST